MFIYKSKIYFLQYNYNHVKNPRNLQHNRKFHLQTNMKCWSIIVGANWLNAKLITDKPAPTQIQLNFIKTRSLLLSWRVVRSLQSPVGMSRLLRQWRNALKVFSRPITICGEFKKLEVRIDATWKYRRNPFERKLMFGFSKSTLSSTKVLQ